MNPEERQFWGLDGDSLLPLARGETTSWKDEAFVEHEAHGTDCARAMVRQGRWKLCYSHGDPPALELYDLASDPGEFANLAGQFGYRDIQDRLFTRIMGLWRDPEQITGEVMLNQEERFRMRQVFGDAPLF